jgi:hypothetical protein
MRYRPDSQLLTPQRVFVALALICILALAGGVYFEVTTIEAHAPHGVERPRAVEATEAPYSPSGRRWFYQKPLWQQPEEAQP